LGAYLESKIIRIVIADDHTLFRQGVRKLLEDQPDFDVVAVKGGVNLDHFGGAKVDQLVKG
jgi:DNA-binding NarL/FixJ family response regulator